MVRGHLLDDLLQDDHALYFRWQCAVEIKDIVETTPNSRALIRLWAVVHLCGEDQGNLKLVIRAGVPFPGVEFGARLELNANLADHDPGGDEDIGQSWWELGGCV